MAFISKWSESPDKTDKWIISNKDEAQRIL
jgi:hypothetical protein